MRDRGDSRTLASSNALANGLVPRSSKWGKNAGSLADTLADACGTSRTSSGEKLTRQRSLRDLKDFRGPRRTPTEIVKSQLLY